METMRFRRFPSAPRTVAKREGCERTGFTLIEVVLALSLFVIAAMIIAPAFAPTERRALESAAYTLRDDLRYAQRMALIKSEQHSLVFNIRENKYSVRKGVNIEREIKLAGGARLVSVNSPTAGRVDYTTRGTTASPCTIELESRGYKQNLTVNLGSGRVQIWDIIKK